MSLSSNISDMNRKEEKGSPFRRNKDLEQNLPPIANWLKSSGFYLIVFIIFLFVIIGYAVKYESRTSIEGEVIVPKTLVQEELIEVSCNDKNTLGLRVMNKDLTLQDLGNPYLLISDEIFEIEEFDFIKSSGDLDFSMIVFCLGIDPREINIKESTKAEIIDIEFKNIWEYIITHLL